MWFETVRGGVRVEWVGGRAGGLWKNVVWSMGFELHVSKMLLRIQFIFSCRCSVSSSEKGERAECFRKKKQRLPETRAGHINIHNSIKTEAQKCEWKNIAGRQEPIKDEINMKWKEMKCLMMMMIMLAPLNGLPPSPRHSVEAYKRWCECLLFQPNSVFLSWSPVRKQSWAKHFLPFAPMISVIR